MRACADSPIGRWQAGNGGRPNGKIGSVALERDWPLFQLRIEWTPAKRILTMMVTSGNEVVGAQDLHATDFAVSRQVETGSWLGRSSQGQGIGKEMRAGILHFAIAGLGAERAVSMAFADNPASLGVSRALGYVDNGEDLVELRGRQARVIRLRL